jgi:hypothetical protein
MTEAELERRWQAEGTRAPIISVQYVRHCIGVLERRARLRNIVEYGGGVVGLAICVWALFYLKGVAMKTAVVLALIGSVVCVLNWWRNDRKIARDVNGVVDALTAYRRELERQHDLHHNNWRWYIAPIIPGGVAMFTALAVEGPRGGWGAYLIALGSTIVWVAALIVANERRAASLQREIDALDTIGAAARGG